MEERQKKDWLQMMIIVLAVLLSISVVFLAGLLVYRYFAFSEPASVEISDNIITPDMHVGESEQTKDEYIENANGGTSNTAGSSMENGGSNTENSAGNSPENGNSVTATIIELHKRNAGDNVPFGVMNMFPGDREQAYFCIKVSYQDMATVKFRANIHQGYEKLAEVLQCKVRLLPAGEVLYVGLMKSMPESLDHTLSQTGEVTEELYYEVTAYLDTGVGNEYQNEGLIADFRWWVEDAQNLSAPKTGDDSQQALWIALLGVSVYILMRLLYIRKKEARNE